MKYPLKMIPAFKDYIWGGSKLRDEYNKDSSLPVIAESWEVSTHPDGLCMVANGQYAGQTLKAVLERHPQWMGERGVPGGLPQANSPCLPVLVKLIDAREKLSLQVHPDDEYARRTEGESGKNEMWYVAEAEPGAELFLGFEHAAGKDELRRLIESGGIEDAVRRVPVKAGECYTVPAGLLHAIGKGIVVAEVQQTSNLTYRVYDYGRVDSAGRTRELHIDKALDVLNTGAAAKKAGSEILTDWEYFKCRLVTLEECGVWSVECGVKTGFECLLVVDIERDRAVTLRYGGGELSLKKGESVFLPAGFGAYTLETGSGRAALLSVSV